MLKIVSLIWSLILIFGGVSGCSSFSTVQHVPTPTFDKDPESAIIILNRPSAIIAAWNNPSVYADDILIGQISNGGTIKWGRKAGTVKLDVYHETNGKHTFPASEIHVVFDVNNNYAYTLNYKFGGLSQPSSIVLEGDESSEIIFTSFPSGATIYAGATPDNLKRTAILTPHSMSRESGSGFWGAEYYKMALDGYKDSPIVFRNNSFGDRIVHYDFTNPSNPVPPKADLPVRHKKVPKILIAPAIPQ